MSKKTLAEYARQEGRQEMDVAAAAKELHRAMQLAKVMASEMEQWSTIVDENERAEVLELLEDDARTIASVVNAVRWMLSSQAEKEFDKFMETCG